MSGNFGDIISADELRMIQAKQVEEKKERFSKENDTFSDRFKKASDIYYSLLLKEVEKSILEAQKTKKTSTFLNYKPLIRDVEGLSYTTLLYGFWNKKENRFDDSKFTELGIEKPLERVSKYLEKFGYKLENVSDSSKSYRLFIKLSW